MSSPAVVKRLQPFTSTIFGEMTSLAQRSGAVNLGQGFPDTDGPPRMLEIARAAIAQGVNQYPPGAGAIELREAIAAHRAKRYNLSYDAHTEVLVTVGAQEGIAATLMALVEPSEEVLLIEPYFDCYPAAVAMAGATHRVVRLIEDPQRKRFALDIDRLKAAITPRTRALLLNSPHNPTGTVFTPQELASVAELCRTHDLIAITDEVYEHLVFSDAIGGTEHVPLATYPGMAERTVSVSSAGKMFNITGWKIGWVCGPSSLISAIKSAKQFLTFASGAPFQPAVAYALANELDWTERLRAVLQRKRDRLSGGLTQAGFTVRHSDGTYFLCADIRPLGYADGAKACRELTQSIGVAGIPIQVLTDNPDPWRHLIRFAFCKSDAVLDQAVDRLRRLRCATPAE